MCYQFIFLILLLLATVIANRQHRQHKNQIKSSHQPEWMRPEKMPTILNDTQNTNFNASQNITKFYTKWSNWTRCINCYQRRTKRCINNNECHDSRIYEERPCGNKRCRRKARQKILPHKIHLNPSNLMRTKQGPSSHIYTRWSKWSPCSRECKTHRKRWCKQFGRCKQLFQEQNAYCYLENSFCKRIVFLLVANNRNQQSENYNSYNSNRKVARSRRFAKKCGVNNKKSKNMKMLKILGGYESERHKWPWHVAVMNEFDEVFCGGTLIAPRWVLTACHCIRKYLKVRINAHNLLEHNDLTMTVKMMFPHPEFNMNTIDNDIALLMLPRAVKTPIACLPNKKPRVRQSCAVMGWGKVKNTDRYGTSVLQETKLPIVDLRTCQKSYNTITTKMLCAGWYSGKSDTCAGDSGGGLMCHEPNRRSKRNAYHVQGITSFGDGCGKKKKYGIYTSVFYYVEWIHNIIDEYH